MRKTHLLILLAGFLIPVTAQNRAPKWLDKQRKAIVQITTYGANNQELYTGTGVFVSESGDILSSYTIFKGASRATVTDTEGKSYPIASVYGADDLYDVIRVKAVVPKKAPFISIASEPLATGAAAYLVPYVAGKAESFKAGQVTEVTRLKEPYGYYKVGIPLEGVQINAPLLTADGQLFGLAQEDAGGKKEHIYAVSAGYINSLRVSSTDMLSSVYSSIGIRKAWPADPDQAEVMLFLLASSQDTKTYLSTLDDFITSFPNESLGYQNRASHYAYNSKVLGASPDESPAFLQKAGTDMETAVRLNPNKAEGLFANAKLIYGIALSDTVLAAVTEWSIQAAMDVLQAAIRVQDSPLYHQLEGDIYFALGEYEKAYDSYMIMNNGNMASAASYYAAAKAKENIPGVNVFDVVNLLSGAIEKSKENPTAETLAYLQERIDYEIQLMMYTEAVADYDLYYQLLNGRVDGDFYYYRSQAKSMKKDLPGALEDIKKALEITSDDPVYLAEEASIYIRTEDYSSAMVSLNKALERAPDFASCHRLMGVCHLRQNNKPAACESFHKAQEFGDTVAERLIKENCQAATE